MQCALVHFLSLLMKIGSDNAGLWAVAGQDDLYKSIFAPTGFNDSEF